MSNWLLTIGLFLTSMLVFKKGQAQNDSTGAAPFSLVKINFEKHRLEPYYLPFDVPFVLAAPAADSLGVNSIVVKCFEKGKPNAVFSETLLKDMFFRDTIYWNIPNLLKAQKTYSFSFVVNRGVTKKEDSELVVLTRPIISQELVKVYKRSINGGGAQFTQLMADPSTFNDLTQALQTILFDYYTSKHLAIRTEINAAVTSDNVQKFIARTFYAGLSTKRNKLDQIHDVIVHQLQPTYLENATPQSNLPNWQIFKLLDQYADTFKLSASLHGIIHNVFRDSDTLRMCVHSFKGPAQDDLWILLDIKTMDINAYMGVSASFADTCAWVANLLKGIENDPTSLNRLLRRLHRDHAELLQAQATIEQEMNAFKRFLNWVQRSNEYIKTYYSNALDADSLFARLSYHIKGEFPITFDDGTVGLTSADFVTRGAWYIIPDLGVAYLNTNPTGQFRPYLGVNFNFVALNRQVPFSLVKPSPHHYTFLGSIWRNLSITVGVTVFNGFTSKDQYQDLFGTTGSLLTGLALRVSDGIRLSGGACWLYKKNPNPISDMKTLGNVGYAALSIDLDLKKWLGGLGSTLFK